MSSPEHAPFINDVSWRNLPIDVVHEFAIYEDRLRTWHDIHVNATRFGQPNKDLHRELAGALERMHMQTANAWIIAYMRNGTGVFDKPIPGNKPTLLSGEELGSMRHALGISQVVLAEVLSDTSQTTISNMESSKYPYVELRTKTFDYLSLFSSYNESEP